MGHFAQSYVICLTINKNKINDAVLIVHSEELQDATHSSFEDKL